MCVHKELTKRHILVIVNLGQKSSSQEGIRNYMCTKVFCILILNKECIILFTIFGQNFIGRHILEVTLHFDCSLWLNLSFYFLTDLQDFLFDSIITFLLYIILIKKLTLNHFLVFNDNLSNNTRFSSISHNPEKEINIRIPALIRSFILYDIHRFIAISRTHNTPFKHGGCCSRNR